MHRAITEENTGVKANIITPEADGWHYFFGYYDLQPFDSTGRYHLCNRVAFDDRLQTPEDVCELGMIDLQKGGFIKLSETNAWNFQQGTLLQWYRDDRHIIYNIFKDGAYRACVQNICSGKRRIYPMAFANISNDGSKALCVNFSRIFDFRPGYGYAAIKDPFYKQNAPEQDGVFLMDMESGRVKQILSYEKIRRTFPEPPYSDEKLLVNHINFNPSATRFVFLLRNIPQKGLGWKTQLLTSDLDGNLYKLTDYVINSHYYWKNDDELLIFSGDGSAKRDNALYLFKDLTDKCTRLPEPNPKDDIHCLYSPNRRYILGDGYPDENGYRWLHLIDTAEHSQIILGKYFSHEKASVEIRCDLHARFDRTGRFVSFDSNHTGRRTICMLDLKQLNGYSY
jgi:hypothetical protein